MKRITKLLALLLCAGLVMTSVPVKAGAQSSILPEITVSCTNPLYGDLVSSSAPMLSSNSPALLSAGEFHRDVEAAGDELREQLKERNTTVSVGFQTSDSAYSNYAYTLMDEAMKHTGVPDEGDYILWQYSRWNCSLSGSQTGGIYYITYTYTMEYFTTADQEDQVDDKIDEVLTELDLDDSSDYRKVRGVYDYLCDNITYDYSSNSVLKHSAYAGIINGTCVCQGYALLMYRMSLELGVDCRLISGDSYGEAHGWNIVKLGDYYYNVDSTWDAGNSTYSYFLKGQSNFADHDRDAEYLTTEFHSAYPTSSTDYVSCDGSDDYDLHSYVKFVTEPTCTAAGSSYECCSACGNVITGGAIPALGHDPVELQAIEPTCTTAGYTAGMECSRCEFVYVQRQLVPAYGHSYENGECLRCGDLKTFVEAPVAKGSNVAKTGKCKLTWDDIDNAMEYKVYRATSKTGKYYLMKTTEGTTYTNTSAKAGSTYYYYVIAVAADGTKSEKSNIVTRTCDCARPAVTATNVASSGKIKLTWDEVDGAVEYKVYRATSKTGEYKLMKTTEGTSYTNTGAVAGKLYYYKVKAIGTKSAATSAYSLVDSRRCDLPRPVVKITTSSGKPRVSWSEVDGAKEYKIYRATSKSGTYKLVMTTENEYWKDTTAVKGKTYYYKVKAIHDNSAANSAYSLIKYIKCTK